MAYDEYLAERISQILQHKKHDFTTKKMMGGLCFMMDGKMLCGIHFDKKKETDLLMARVGDINYETAIQKPNALPMDFTGRPMKGYVFITPEGFDLDADLEYWLDLCIAFNPLAKSSKKRSKK